MIAPICMILKNNKNYKSVMTTKLENCYTELNLPEKWRRVGRGT